MNSINFVFFGASDAVTIVLERLKTKGFVPGLIVTTPDMPVGRKHILTPPPAKVWGDQNKISVLQPKKLDEEFTQKLKAQPWDLFIVATYGTIIPQAILDIPHKGAVNIHPSLLPLYRGPSPIKSQILANEEFIGTTIMLMDEKMDHGPILAQEEIPFGRKEGELVQTHPEIEKIIWEKSADLLIEILPEWLKGSVAAQEQDHGQATFTRFFKKEDGLIDLKDDPRKNYRKYLAYQPWPGTFFFAEKDGIQTRVLIRKARFENNLFVIETVLPEGKKEITYEKFLLSSV